jgi:hypothetical protein
MKRDIKQLEKQGLKEGMDFDVIVKEEGETDEEGMNKLLDNRFIKEDLINIGNVGKNVKLTEEDKDNLIIFLEEYLNIFKDKKEHQETHKKEPCYKCDIAKQLLRKLKK